MKTEEKIGYARYADDMLVAIKSGIDSEGVYHRFRQIFQKALKKIKLAETSLEIRRGIPRKILVLGLVVSIGPSGNLETRAPFKRWKKKLTLEHIMAKMEEKEREK